MTTVFDQLARLDKQRQDRTTTAAKREADNAKLRALVEELTGALKSIARNSCCGVCREAAAVAARALGWYLCHKCGALNEIVNQCGCDPNNLPTRAKEGSGT